MSNNRNKKSPMFVSNINTQYEFADYTEPHAKSAFGNPHQQTANQESPQTNSAFKKNDKSSNNWFEQMLQTQQQTTLTSPRNVDQPQRSPQELPANTYQQQPQNQSQIRHVSQHQQYQQYPQPQTSLNQQYSQNNNFSHHESLQVSQPQNARQNPQTQNQQQQRFNPQRQFNSQIQNNQNYSPQQNKPFAPQSSQLALGVNERSGRSYHNVQGNVQTTISQRGNPNSYEYKAKIETLPDQKQTGSNFSYSQEVNYSKQQLPSPKSNLPNQPQYTSSTTSYSSSFSSSFNNSNPSSNSSSGLTDESIIDCLPEPARSNILAMIRRSKGQA